MQFLLKATTELLIFIGLIFRFEFETLNIQFIFQGNNWF